MTITDGAFRQKVERLLREASRLERENKDRLESARTRFEASRNLETPDRIPVTVSLSPVWSNWYFRKRYHIRIGEYWRNPELLVEYQLRVYIDSFRDFEDDRPWVIPGEVGPIGGVVLHPSIVGCWTIFPEDDFAWIDLSHRAFDSKEKIDEFATPDIPAAGLMPETLGRLEKIESLVGDLLQVRIQGGDGGPLQMAAYTRGIRELIRDMYTDPPIVRKLMGKMLDVYDAIRQYYRQTWGIEYEADSREGHFYDNPLAYFSPALVEEYVLPYYRSYAEKCGWTKWVFETQGVMDEFIELFRMIPVGQFGNLVSSSDLAGFREAFAPRGVRFSVFLAPGRLVSMASIRAEVARITNAMGLTGGWTLSSGVLDAAIPQTHIHAFLRTAKECGSCR